MRIPAVFLLITVLLFASGCTSGFHNGTLISIPASGNSWKTYGQGNYEKIKAYFYTDTPGTIYIGLRAKIDSASQTIKISTGGITKKVRIDSPEYDTLIAGNFSIENPGYQTIEMEYINNPRKVIPEISNILIGGPATIGKLFFIKDDFYFGRRGPSVHLRYDIPEEASEIEWFYSEITVPPGDDVEGSFFMANGFDNGYFGIQVNSKDERRILFSVWSPFNSDNPDDIPEDSRIILLKKGEDVSAGEFGNEGSGGQSFRTFMWKPGLTYRFLVKCTPSVNKSTDYTAYFFAPETGQWELIAAFRRPKTISYLKNLYSFLENFIPETGNITRKAYYSNQWICNSDGSWYEINAAMFTADATARKEARLDYAGGVKDNSFYLMNCGFFNEKTGLNSRLEHPVTNNKPDIERVILMETHAKK